MFGDTPIVLAKRCTRLLAGERSAVRIGCVLQFAVRLRRLCKMQKRHGWGENGRAAAIFTLNRQSRGPGASWRRSACMQHANRDAEDRDKMPGPNQISFSGPAQAWRGREGRSPANLHRRRNLLTRPYCCLLGWCPIDCSLCENWSVRIGKGGKEKVCAWVNGGGGVAGVERDFSNRHLRSPAGLRHLCVSTAIAMAPGCLDGARHGPSSSRWHLRLIKLPSLES